jgi:hypothetical protein
MNHSKTKLLLTLLALFIYNSSISAQEYNFSNLKGIKDSKENIFFSVGGYDVIISSVNKPLKDKKTVSKLLKKNENKTKIESEYANSSFEQENRILLLEAKPLADSLVYLNQVYYLFEKTDKTTESIYFATYNSRDTLLERAFIKEYLSEKLNRLVTSDLSAESIFFAGSIIDLGTACQWRSPNNIYFQGGQVSWREFNTMEEAIMDRNRQMMVNTELAINLEEEDIDILFMDKPVTAKRVAYLPKEKYSRGTLLVYYVAIELNGYYISCILSGWGYNRNDYELPLLLREFMTIPELPYTAISLFDTPVYETPHEDQIDPTSEWAHLIEFQILSRIPMGNLSNTYNIAPGIGITAGLPLRNNSFVIDLFVSACFPVGRNYFDYLYKDGETDRTKARALIQLGARARHQRTLKKNLFLNTYAGIGYSGLETNIITGYDHNDNEEYAYINAPLFNIGASLRYKHIGVFLEYQLTPYSFSSRVKNDIGNSSINIGLFYGF